MVEMGGKLEIVKKGWKSPEGGSNASGKNLTFRLKLGIWLTFAHVLGVVEEKWESGL